MKYGARLLDSPVPKSVPFVDLTKAHILVAAPNETDWSLLVPPDGDPLGNDDFSNCYPAAMLRTTQLHYAARYKKQQAIDTSDVLKLYSRVSDFNANTKANDVGTDPNRAMGLWARDADTVIFADENWPIVWARVSPNKPAEIAAAMHYTPLMMEVWLAQSDADDPDNWENPPGNGKGWEGTIGHEMVLVRNSENDWKVRTWGRDYLWHPDRLKYVHGLTAPLDATRTDFTRLGVDFDQAIG